MKQSLQHPWVEVTIKLAVSETGRYFNIIFDNGEETLLNYKYLAYINTSRDAQYPVGSKVIAKFQDINIQFPDKKNLCKSDSRTTKIPQQFPVCLIHFNK